MIGITKIKLNQTDRDVLNNKYSWKWF